MNTIKNSVFTFIAIVLFQFVGLAQEPGDFGGVGDGNATDAPIDTYVWILLIVGLGFAFYKYIIFTKSQVNTFPHN
jgi:hypothetical protein